MRRLNGKEFMGRRLVVEPYIYRGGDPRYRPQVAEEGRGSRERGGADGDRYRNSNSNSSWRPPFGGGGGYGGGYGPSGGSGFRLLVFNLDAMTSWQDLKDFGRSAGKSASFADVYTRQGKKQGIIEYREYEDCRNAVRELDETPQKRGGSGSRERSRGRERERSRERERERERHSRSRSPNENERERER